VCTFLLFVWMCFHTLHSTNRVFLCVCVTVTGVKGFEPLNVDTKNRCLTAWLYSNCTRVLFSLFVCTNSKLFIFVYRWGGAGGMKYPPGSHTKCHPRGSHIKTPPTGTFLWPAHKIGRSPPVHKNNYLCI
jgi:hypothetical protein